MLLNSDKTADHEMCSSSDYDRFHCVRFTSVRSVTTAVSGEDRPAIYWRSDHHRRRFSPTVYETSACYSAEISAVSAATRRRFACVNRGFLTSDPKLRRAIKRAGREWRQHGAADIDGHGLYSKFAIDESTSLALGMGLSNHFGGIPSLSVDLARILSTRGRCLSNSGVS